jgi:hypothetical protein
MGNGQPKFKCLTEDADVIEYILLKDEQNWRALA